MDVTTLKALAEPNRLRIVEALSAGPYDVGSLTKQLDMHQPQTSKHLRVLSEAGIVVAETDAQRRVYSLRPEPFQELGSWLEQISRLWGERLDRLDAVLQGLQEGASDVEASHTDRDHHQEKSP